MTICAIISQGVSQKNLKKITKFSKSMRRDRELSFYGTEDLTPSEFYQKEDADEAREWAQFLVELTDTPKS